MAHSHGCNVVAKAAELGSRFGEVLLLSCPVRTPMYKYTRIGQRVRSVRTRLDLIVLADRVASKIVNRTGTTFPRNAKIEERVVEIWFQHSATTDPDVWRKHGIRIWPQIGAVNPTGRANAVVH